MADIQKFTEDLAIIQKLGDNPNTDNGLSAAELKVKFDAASLAIQKFINNILIPGVNNRLSKGENIDMSGKKVTGLGNPTADGDAVNLKYLHAHIQKARPYNLLDNSDFRNPVNQRGGESFIKKGYTIDRWMSASTALEVDIEDDCVRLYNGAASAANGFSQPLAPERELAEGTIVTMACKFLRDDGTEAVICGSCAVPASNYSIAKKDEWDGTQLRFYAKSHYGYQLFSIMVPAGIETRIVWAALYVGEYTIDTLPVYQAKDHTTETQECQRYFLRHTGSGFGYVYSLTTAYMIITTPVEMRITPTVSGDVMFAARAGNGTKANDCTFSSNVYKNNNQIRFSLDVTDKGLAVDSVITVSRTSGVLEFSAEL